MYYVISSDGVKTGKNIEELNRKMKVKFDESEFNSIGNDKVVKVSDKDIEFVIDKKNIEKIPFEKILGVKDINRILLYIILGLSVVIFLKC